VLAFPHDTRHHMSTGETSMERMAVAPPVTPPSVLDRTRVRHAATRRGLTSGFGLGFTAVLRAVRHTAGGEVQPAVMFTAPHPPIEPWAAARVPKPGAPPLPTTGETRR
jgi:hypothetical protein